MSAGVRVTDDWMASCETLGGHRKVADNPNTPNVSSAIRAYIFLMGVDPRFDFICGPPIRSYGAPVKKYDVNSVLAPMGFNRHTRKQRHIPALFPMSLRAHYWLGKKLSRTGFAADRAVVAESTMKQIEAEDGFPPARGQTLRQKAVAR